MAGKKTTFTVALMGADGSGKSTLTRLLSRELPFPVKYLYMGVNLESSRLVLPTTWLILALKRFRGGRPDMAGPPDPKRRKPLPKNPIRRAYVELKSCLRVMNLAAEEWFRQIVSWCYRKRGYTVLFDRHFLLEFCGHQRVYPDSNSTIAQRLHLWALERFYPRPDVTIYLDAPAEVLFARKGEGSPELLELRRQMYLRLGELVERFEIVDCARPLPEVAADVMRRICIFHGSFPQPPRGGGVLPAEAARADANALSPPPSTGVAVKESA